jgi:hypothetical protein
MSETNEVKPETWDFEKVISTFSITDTKIAHQIEKIFQKQKTGEFLEKTIGIKTVKAIFKSLQLNPECQELKITCICIPSNSQFVCYRMTLSS